MCFIFALLLTHKYKTMIKVVLSFVLFLISISLFSQDNTPKGVDIQVSVSNFTNDKGIAVFSLFEENGFLEKPIQKIEKEVVDGKSVVIFKNIPNGTYAILCHHDSNDNGDLDFSENGMPLEDIGVSNSVIRFGPPSFEKSKFEVTDKNLELKIKF